MKAGRQTTLRHHASVSGIGVHSGLPITLSLHPADADTGIVFLRTAPDQPDRMVRAAADGVTATDFATVLGDASGPVVSTVEHVMAALRGLGIDNAIVELDGPEAPILDGSAAPLVALVDRAGVMSLSAPRRYLQVLRPLRVAAGGSHAELWPNPRGFRVEVEIDFDHTLIGRQSLGIDVTPASFRRELARARTFGFLRDVARLWASGYAFGANLDNTVVVAENRVLNVEGLRFADEFARHKALDAIGDLALVGAPILGTYRSVRGGHKLNHAMVCALMADRSAWTMVEAEEPVRRIRGHADVTAGLVAPAYAPELS